MSGTWPGFSADWEESSEYQEAKARARLERQKLAGAITTPTAPRERLTMPCPHCGQTLSYHYGSRKWNHVDTDHAAECPR